MEKIIPGPLQAPAHSSGSDSGDRAGDPVSHAIADRFPEPSQPHAIAVSHGKLGILLDDSINRRLIDGISAQLELVPIELSEDMLNRVELSAFELLVADEAVARRVRILFNEPHDNASGHSPALVAVRPKSDQAAPTEKRETVFDGILTLPEQPALVVAQLSIILYAHRASAQRFQSALDELQLNRRIFRSVTSGITIARATDPDMPLIYVNPAFEVITGYSAEETVGRNCRFLQLDDSDQPGLSVIREAIRERREATALIRNYRKDGTLFWNEFSISPIRNRDNEVTHFVGFQNDVTARVEYESTLRESEKLATAGRLAASIAHEINNPLEAITNLLYLARTSTDPEEIQGYIAQAETELQRVAQLTSQSLKFYRQSTAPTHAHPAELLASILDLYRGKLESARIEIHLRHRPCEPVLCLESEIRQVLSNLIRNASDSMHGKLGRLHVRTRLATNWRTGVKGARITIADTGCGMSPETARRMYEAFYTTKGIHGTGLGLWVSEEIVARHKGRLAVRSRRGAPSGTVFSLFLPSPRKSA